jgi:hypothetical protein
MYTTQKQVRAAFWETFAGEPGISRRKIKHYSGSGKMHNTDTRCAFVDFIDALARDGRISESLAERVTL